MLYVVITMDADTTTTYTVNFAKGRDSSLALPLAKILKVDRIANHVIISPQPESRVLVDGDQVVLHPQVLGAITDKISGMLLRLVFMPEGQWLYLDTNTMNSQGISLRENQQAVID